MAWSRLTRLVCAVVCAALTCAPEGASAQTAEGMSQKLQYIRTLLDDAKFGPAETAARVLLTEVEASHGQDSAEVAPVLDILVESLNGGIPFYYPNRRPPTDALAVARRALELKQRHFGPESPQVAVSLRGFAIASWLQGNVTEAKIAYERAIAIQEKMLPPNDPALAASLKAFAGFLRQREDWTAARGYLERSLEIYESAFGPEHQRVAASCAYLGAHLRDMGEYSTAIALLQRSLAIREKLYGPEDPDVAGSLNSLAGVYFMRGDWPEAERLLGKAIAIQEKSSRTASVAIMMFNKGLLLLQIGDNDGAKAAYTRGLAIVRKLEGEESTNIARGLGELGDVYLAEGDVARAKELKQSAVAIREKVDGLQSPRFGVELDSYAVVLARSGQLDAALRTWERALNILEKSGAPESWRAKLLHNMASALAESDPARAKEILLKALAIHEKLAPEPTLDLAATVAQLARTQAYLGKHQEALSLSLRAEEVSRNHLQLTLGVLSERQALTFADSREAGLDLALSLLRDADSVPTVLDAVVRSRALVLDEMASRHRAFVAAGDTELKQTSRRLRTARERLANLVVRGPDGDAGQYRRMMERARQEKEDLERALAEGSSAFREEQKRHRIGLEEVAKALPSDSALIAFVRFRRYSFAKSSAGKLPLPVGAYGAFILQGPKDRPLFVNLGAADRIDALVARWREQLLGEAIAAGRGHIRNETRYRQAGAELRRAVWDPIMRLAKRAQRVFVVPDGALHLVNFAALPLGQTHYEVESDHQIHYLTAEHDLPGPAGAVLGEGLLVLGAPAFNDTGELARAKIAPQDTPPLTAAQPVFRSSRSACRKFESTRFEPLPGTGREIAEIAQLWRASTRVCGLRAVGSAGADITYLRGAKATEAAFKQHASGKRVLHLATHGFFLGGHCPSGLHPVADTAGKILGENPLLLSGLVLAGANQRARAGIEAEDGVLTAEEIASLDLHGVDWAVLSACDTGLGELRAGEGILGLRRAFQTAGVRTVILSLWAVDDEATRQWMRRLYRARLLEGQSTIEAVHSASLQSLASRRAKGQSTHPFYWAPFVAAGDWR